MKAKEADTMTALTYTPVGDYLIPDITLQHADESIGLYGRMRRDYLKEHCPILYNELILSEQLFPHLQEVDHAAHERVRVMLPQMKAKNGITEELKAKDQMRWVREMISIRETIHEIIMNELICA